MNPNVLFVVYCLIAIPIFFTSKSLSAYSIGLLIGQSIIPIVLIVIYNKKQDSKAVKRISNVGIILWTLITIFAYLGQRGMRM